jgi:hypothetical protein
MNPKAFLIIVAALPLFGDLSHGAERGNASATANKKASFGARLVRLVTKETSMGVVPAMADYLQCVLSRDQSHIVYPVMRRGTWYLFKDGVEMEDNSKGYSRIALPTFSPDGKRLAFFGAIAGGGWTAVVNGKESPPYDMPVECHPLFSPDSGHVAYFMNRGGSQILVVDSKEERVSKGAYLEDGTPIGIESIDNRSLQFSPDGERFSYVFIGRDWEQVVTNGKPGPKYKNVSPPGPCFSPDGTQLVYGAQTSSNQWVIVRNDKESRPIRAKGIRDFVFSPDSSQLAYLEAPEDGQGMHMVVRGRREKQFYGVALGSFRFSPNGRRYMYVGGTTPSQQVIVIDGQESGPYAGVSPDTHVFSPDSQHFAYGATRGVTSFAVIDGEEWGQFEFTAKGSFVFSPDSQHLVFVGIRDGKSVIVVDHTEGKEYGLVKIPGTSQYYGKSIPVFDSPRKFHFQSARLTASFEVEIIRVDVEIVEE